MTRQRLNTCTLSLPYTPPPPPPVAPVPSPSSPSLSYALSFIYFPFHIPHLKPSLTPSLLFASPSLFFILPSFLFLHLFPNPPLPFLNYLFHSFSRFISSTSSYLFFFPASPFYFLCISSFSTISDVLFTSPCISLFVFCYS